MPNYCINTLTVKGEHPTVTKFHHKFTQHASNDELYSFVGFVPDPTNIEERWDKWGTKWDACYGEILHVMYGNAKYRFDTAWAPPIPVFEAMQREFPDLDIEAEWVEPGMGFQGELKADGTIIHEDYESDDEETA